MALWFSTIQGAFCSQVMLAQGSTHWKLTHAWLGRHPLSLRQIETEGLQPSVHMQRASWFRTWHVLPSGQRLTWHGFWQDPPMQDNCDGQSSLLTQVLISFPGQVSSPTTLMTSFSLQTHLISWFWTTHFSASPQYWWFLAQGLIQAPYSQTKEGPQSSSLPHSFPLICGTVRILDILIEN